MAATHGLLVTLEENVVAGGAGSGVNEFMAESGMLTPILNLGLPDQYIDHGSQASQLAQCGLDSKGIEQSILASPYYTSNVQDYTSPAQKKQSKSV